jgi:ubiquinone/menaquinone biosynthesis C-methylase UbiE
LPIHAGLFMLKPVFDEAAPTFDRYRALPEGAAEAIRGAVLAAVDAPHPRLLDLGAGTGRIGWPFAAARDDYVGVDLSFAMLRAFQERVGWHEAAPCLVQSDGQLLPFRNAAFDAVLMVQIFGGLRGWRRLLAEARRVLRPDGALFLGRSMAPDDGVDARMKAQLALLLEAMAAAPGTSAREDAHRWLDSTACNTSRVIAAAWEAAPSPRAFLDRHRTGARFSALPEPVKAEALGRLAAWAEAAFGSLDAEARERYAFELRIFHFNGGAC